MWKFDLLAALFLLGLTCVSRAEPGPPEGYTIESQPQDFVVLQGEPVTLPCLISDPDQYLRTLWQNGSSPISMNHDLWYSHGGRVELAQEEGVFDLIIHSAELVDEGDYSCQVAGSYPSSVSHTLTVNIPPSLLVDNREDTLSVGIEEEAVLECQADGKPQPKIVWRRLGQDLPNGEKQLEGEVLNLESMGREDGGDYECLAYNGFGQNASRVFFVMVVWEPTVTVEETITHTGPGDDVEIKCIFDASPQVQVIWKHNDSDINFSERTNVVTKSGEEEDGRQHSILKINNLLPGDLGSYTCQGANKLGEAEEDFHLSALPHSIEFLSEAEGEFSDQYTLRWQVSSVPSPVEFYLILTEYNFNGTDEDRILGNSTVPAHVQPGAVHPQEFLITGLHANGSYSVRLKCKNIFGMSDWSEDYFFYTSEEENPAPPPTNPPKTTEGDKVEEGDNTKATPSYNSAEDGILGPTREDNDNDNGVAAVIPIITHLVAIVTAAVLYN